MFFLKAGRFCEGFQGFSFRMGSKTAICILENTWTVLKCEVILTRGRNIVKFRALWSSLKSFTSKSVNLIYTDSSPLNLKSQKINWNFKKRQNISAKKSWLRAFNSSKNVFLFAKNHKNSSYNFFHQKNQFVFKRNCYINKISMLIIIFAKHSIAISSLQVFLFFNLENILQFALIRSEKWSIYGFLN